MLCARRVSRSLMAELPSFLHNLFRLSSIALVPGIAVMTLTSTLQALSFIEMSTPLHFTSRHFTPIPTPTTIPTLTPTSFSSSSLSTSSHARCSLRSPPRLVSGYTLITSTAIKSSRMSWYSLNVHLEVCMPSMRQSGCARPV